MAKPPPSPEHDAIATSLAAPSSWEPRRQRHTASRNMTQLRQAQAELDYRLGFEDFLVSLCTRFINLPLGRFDAELDDALRQVTRFTSVSRSYLYLFDEQKKTAHLYAEWSAPGLPPMADALRQLRLDDYAWAEGPLYNNQLVHIPTLADLPAAAGAFREQLAALHVKSYINVPMLLGEEAVGHLGCTTYEQEKTWSNDEIALLRLFGSVLINAIKRRETEVTLAEQERRLRLTVESLEEGVFDWDVPSGRVYLSDYLKRSVGMPETRDGWSFDGWADRIHPDDRAQVMASLNDHLEGRAPVYRAEYRFLTDNKGYRWMLSRGRVVEHADDGVPVRMVGVQRDITQQREQQEEHRRQETQLAHLGRVATMGETVAGIAHEVNQPLHAASAFCSAARNALQAGRPGAAEKAAELCQQAVDQVQRAGDIMHRLRDFTRPRPTDVSAINLHETIEQAIGFVVQVGASRGVLVRVDFARIDLHVLADRVQLQQVLVNLVQNACDSLASAGGAEPAIVVSTRQGEGVAEVAVRDNASTPPPEEPETLFDAFYTTKPDGMGIGLALCRTILSAHGGEIRAEANQDRGMTFRFTLPLADAPPAPTPGGPGDPAAAQEP